MLSWQPHPPSLSSARRAALGGAQDNPVLALQLADQTGTFSVPSPAELGLAPRPCAQLLTELLDIDALRQPLIRELAALLRRRGADERELLSLARELWRAQVQDRRTGMSFDVPAPSRNEDDVPVRRKAARARAVEIAAG